MTLDAAIAHHRAGRFAEAEGVYQQILAANPRHADALHLLGMLRHQQGDNAAAERLMRQALDLRPDVAHFHANLGGILGIAGRPLEAIESLRSAIRLKPAWAEAHNNLGVAFEQLGQHEEAIAAYREAIALRPDYPEAHNHLGNTLRKSSWLDEAEACHRNAISLRPSYLPAYDNLAATLIEAGEQEKSVECYRHALSIDPSSAATRSNLLFLMYHCDGFSPRQLFEEHLKWDSLHAPPERRIPHAPGIKGPDRPLRVGYVSPDFRRHSVATFFEPLLASHDTSQFKIFCYSDASICDAVTERLRRTEGVEWRNISRRADDQVLSTIQEDRIDILVDLTGHMAANRLTLFARRAAPIQVTYLGAPHTTGLSAIQYRLTDSLVDPPAVADHFNVETLIRLPRCEWCYRPPENCPVSPPPFRGNGQITFGSLNRPIKLTPRTIDLWSSVLKAVPESRLLILLGSGMAPATRLRERFNAYGVDPARIDFVLKTPPNQFHRLCDRIDIGLDTFPYAGQTTTCDMLWMGVPVISLAGESGLSRAGLSILTSVGLPDLVAQSPEQYVAIAAGLARDPERLLQLRSTLRDRFANSELRDERGLGRSVEAAYRSMWKR